MNLHHKINKKKIRYPILLLHQKPNQQLVQLLLLQFQFLHQVCFYNYILKKKSKALLFSDTEFFLKKLFLYLDSPVRRPASPTMTMMTRAATDDVYEMFNQPLQADNSSSDEFNNDADENDDDVFNDDEEEEEEEVDDGDVNLEDSNTTENKQNKTNESLGMINNLRNQTQGLSINSSENEQQISNASNNNSINDDNNNTNISSSLSTSSRYAPNFPPMTPIVERTENVSNYDLQVEDIANSPNNPFQNNGKLTKITKIEEEEEEKGKDTESNKLIQDLKCDPTSETHKQEVLEHTNPSLMSMKTFHFYPMVDFNKKEILKRTFSVKNKSEGGSFNNNINGSNGSGRFQPPVIEYPKKTTLTENGDNENIREMYCIRKLIGEGGFGCVYLGESESGAIYAIKIEDTPNVWEYHIISQLHMHLLNQNTINSKRVSESIIKAHDQYLFKDESHLVMDYSSQGTILDAVNISRQQTGGGLDEYLTMLMTIELLRVMEEIHNAGIIHCDIKPDNIMLRLESIEDNQWNKIYKADGSDGWRSKGIKIIDFGRGIDTKAYRKDAQFIATWKVDNQDCAEMQQGVGWTYQPDYHGIASVIHLMLFGKYIQISQKRQQAVSNKGTPLFEISSPLKRYWNQNLWSKLFDLLLNSKVYSEEKVEEQQQQHILLEQNQSSSSSIWPITPYLTQIRKEFELFLEHNCESSGGKSLKGSIKELESSLKKL